MTPPIPVPFVAGPHAAVAVRGGETISRVIGDFGKTIRIRRISESATGRFLVVPMDHGVTVGPVAGLEDLAARIGEADRGGATSVVVHKGEVGRYVDAQAREAGLIVHLSASLTHQTDPNRKVLVGTVEEAVMLGADAVSVHVNVGSPTTEEMISDAGVVAHDCRLLGVPLLVMVYPRGPEVKDPYDAELVAHCARAAEEVGADIIKTNYTGDVDSFSYVVGSVRNPVITAGGPPSDDPLAPLAQAAGTVEAGGAGVACGRNVFQHEDPEAMTRALASVIFDGASPEEAAKEHLGGTGGI
ncbi:MAG: class I fructose-bisphosphate aldolase family protein [Thermoplasmata archaeon]|nr:MAG: class I fructose-bisphosphate aldolase family protein [Thermoplasmata archaeon]